MVVVCYPVDETSTSSSSSGTGTTTGSSSSSTGGAEPRTRLRFSDGNLDAVIGAINAFNKRWGKEHRPKR